MDINLLEQDKIIDTIKIKKHIGYNHTLWFCIEDNEHNVNIIKELFDYINNL